MQISDEMKALEALARAYDHEEAACMGEPSPWVSADEEGDDEWKAERIVAARAGLEAYRSALSLPVQPVAWIDPAQLDVLAKTKTSVLPYLSWKQSPAYPQPLYTTPPVPPTKGPEDDLRAAREAAAQIAERFASGTRTTHFGESYTTIAERTRNGDRDNSADVQSALLALRSRPASALPVVGEDAAWADVIAERKRQVEKEGWTPEHDDAHDKGELARAAACYAGRANAGEDGSLLPPITWPWSNGWWKIGPTRRMLVKSGALILAEIERLDRADALIPSVQP